MFQDFHDDYSFQHLDSCIWIEATNAIWIEATKAICRGPHLLLREAYLYQSAEARPSHRNNTNSCQVLDWIVPKAAPVDIVFQRKCTKALRVTLFVGFSTGAEELPGGIA
jgi:hypothetical protein